MSSSLITLNPRIPRYVPPVVVPPPVYTGPGAGIYTRNYTISGIYAGTYPFQVRIPIGYDNAVASPVMLCLGGSSSRGTNGTSMMSDTLLANIEAHALPVIVIYGQYQATGPNGGREAGWPMIPSIMAVVASEWNCDPLRNYATGWSAGGLLLLESLFIYPTQFAAMNIAEAYCNRNAMVLAGATVSPLTDREGAKQAALAAPNTYLNHFQNSDDGTVTPTQATSVLDGFTDAGHAHYYHDFTGTGGHDPGFMEAGGLVTNYTNRLFTQHL